MKLIRSNLKDEDYGRLFVGLPIKASIDLPALVCANFELDPGRNALKPESSWNNQLLSGVCVEAYMEMMEAVRNDIIQVQKVQSHTVTMDHSNPYGEAYHLLFPRPATQTSALFPFMKSFYFSIQEKELVPCIFVDVDQKQNERSYFKFQSLRSSLILDEKMSQQKFQHEMNLLMKLRCPVVFFRYKLWLLLIFLLSDSDFTLSGILIQRKKQERQKADCSTLPTKQKQKRNALAIYHQC